MFLLNQSLLVLLGNIDTLNGRVRHVEMLDNNTTPFPTTNSASYASSSPVSSTTSSDKNDESIWSQHSTEIIVSTSVIIFVVIIFIVSMAVFLKWKAKRRTEGNYNPSGAEKHENQKNKLVFSIPLPTPERLI